MPGEEDLLIFEYLNLLVSRPEVARQLGERARDYVASECNWANVAAQYAGFLDSVIRGMPFNAETQRTQEGEQEQRSSGSETSSAHRFFDSSIAWRSISTRIRRDYSRR